MKRIILITIIFISGSFSIFAQGLYFDIGAGIGKSWAKIDGKDVAKAFNLTGSNIKEDPTLDLGLKIGYGPFEPFPIYIVGELGFVVTTGTITPSDANYNFTSFIVGPGILFYPVPIMQLGLSLGYSFVYTNFYSPPVDKSKWHPAGFAWNISVGLNIGGQYNSILIGAKYFMAINNVENNKNLITSMIGGFVKYSFRHKPT